MFGSTLENLLFLTWKVSHSFSSFFVEFLFFLLKHTKGTVKHFDLTKNKQTEHPIYHLFHVANTMIFLCKLLLDVITVNRYP